MNDRPTLAILSITLLCLAAVGCGSGADDSAGAAAAAPAAAAVAPAPAAAPLTVTSAQAGEMTLDATDAYWVAASDAYYDIYLTGHPMTSSSFAYGPSIPDGEVLVVAPVENQDGTPIAAGQTFTFDSSSKSRLTAMIRTASGRETFTVVDDVSLGSLTIQEISGDTLRGEIEVAKDDKVVRGSFTARRLPG